MPDNLVCNYRYEVCSRINSNLRRALPLSVVIFRYLFLVLGGFRIWLFRANPTRIQLKVKNLQMSCLVPQERKRGMLGRAAGLSWFTRELRHRKEDNANTFFTNIWSYSFFISCKIIIWNFYLSVGYSLHLLNRFKLNLHITLDQYPISLLAIAEDFQVNLAIQQILLFKT